MTTGKYLDEIHMLLSQESARAAPDAGVTWEVQVEPGGKWEADYTTTRPLSGNEKRELLVGRNNLKRQFHAMTD